MLVTDDTLTLQSAGDNTAALYYHAPEVGHGRWIQHPLYANKFFAVTSTGTVYANASSGTSCYYVVPEPFGADYDVSGTILANNVIELGTGIMGRCSKTANTMYLLRMLPGSGILDLSKLVNSTLTQLGAFAKTWTAGTFKMTLRMRGSQISALLDDVEVIAPVPDTSITSVGAAGIRQTRGASGSTGQHYTRFQVEDFTTFDQTPNPTPAPAPDYQEYLPELYARPVELFTAKVLPSRVDGAMGVNVDANNIIDNGVQYAVWTNELRKPIIGKRALPDGTWSTFDLSTVSGNPLVSPTLEDPHNTYVLAVSADGHIHVMGNHHDVALRYVRTATPGDITSFASATISGSGSSVTYPVFVKRTPSGELCVTWRIGVSGSGDQWWSRYDSATHAWGTPTKIVTGSGTESAYFNRLTVGPDGAVHAFYCWRSQGGGANDNSDICHIKSPDLGVTWTAVDGSPLSLPVTHAASPKVLDTPASGSGLLNSAGADVDANGHPHAAFFLYDANGFTQINHVYHDGTTWHVTPVTTFAYRHDMNVTIVRPVVARPGVVCGTTGNTYIIGRHNVALPGKLWIINVTPGAQDLVPRLLWNTELFYYEPSGIDLLTASTLNVLSLMLAPVSDYGFGAGYENADNARTNFSSVPGFMYTLPLDQVSELPPA